MTAATSTLLDGDGHAVEDEDLLVDENDAGSDVAQDQRGEDTPEIDLHPIFHQNRFFRQMDTF